ncbi:hypothetical protein M569_13934 [Genlisea aurea]|uniref:LysM domain-containing protein n=1 Tax=Genlisea aurea TaxID=192259 RepID=S8DDR3_9LAMI|nr:hypothetical protein M569_13934 [Genlisea aurea]
MPCGGRKKHSDHHRVVDSAASWSFAAVLVAVILISGESYSDEETMTGGNLRQATCDEIYVVGEGETLHTISDKCGDPFIVERNPHIHDPDDVFPGLVIKINPLLKRV